MGIYDEQIKQRIETDAENVQQSLLNLAGVVMGNKIVLNFTAGQISKNAITEVLHYYDIKPVDLPDNITDINDQLDYMLLPAGVMRRNVRLEKGWHKNAYGAMIAKLKATSEVVELLPKGIKGYCYWDSAASEYKKVTCKNADIFDETAVCLFKPLPQTHISKRDFFLFFIRTLSTYDLILLAFFTLFTTLIALIFPYITNELFKSTTYGAEVGSIILPALCVLVGATISSMLFNASSQLVANRIVTKSELSVSAAMMGRVLSLPAHFFRGKSTGDISSRLNIAENLCSIIIKTCIITTLSTLFSLAFIGQIYIFAPVLFTPSLLLIACNLVVSVLTSLAALRHNHHLMNLQTQEKGIMYSLIRGIVKIKVSGSEARAFTKWTRIYEKIVSLMYSPPFLVKFGSVLSLVITSLGTIWIYYAAITRGVSMPDYMAFNMAFGQVSGAFMALTNVAMSIATIAIQMQYLKPILAEIPETSEGKKIITKLTGAIELNNVSFHYSSSTPYVLNNFSLKVRRNQSIAIVGRSGCGKSTLVRLLLGFEKPDKGAIYYDGKDLNTIEKCSLRKHIGVVPQDGKLFQGDIYHNISISAPHLTSEAAWEALEIADIAEDVAAMPMSIRTIITEGGGDVSGGQRHRLMIARAIAHKPKILILDEATSSLDNITQRNVTENLRKLRCTKIIIAHRLSTIKHVDRIIVLEDGHIVEDGTFDSLMKKDGLFAELMRKQM